MEPEHTMTYEGPFSIQIISTLAKFSMESILASEQAREKLYRVFIELAQNVALYSFHRVKTSTGSFIGKGKVCITDEEHKLRCTTINEIQKEHGSVLNTNCTEINNTTLNNLRAKKRSLRKKAEFEDTGAHIGLIMICIYSENPLSYEIINDTNSDKMYFKISATINKRN
jgi:hypothetical protein